MSDGERRRPEPTERMRPEPTLNMWILVVVTVTVVIFLGLIAWYGRFPSFFPIEKPTDRESIHQLAQGWSAQWPQVAGPAQAHRDRAQAALLASDDPEAIKELTRALALEPDNIDALLMLVLASQSGAAGALTPEQQEDVREVVDELEPSHPLVPVVAAWTATEGPQAALAALGAPPDPPLGALVRMMTLRAEQQDASDAAAAVREVAPGHPIACELVARRQIDRSQAAGALEVLGECAEAGATGAALDRLRADALDRAGLFQEAARLYRDSGLDTHAAAIFIQEGGAGEADIEALLPPGPPDAALHLLWWGILSSNADRIARARAELEASSVGGLPFEIAAAAAALAQGEPSAALERLGELEAPQAHALRARALLALGDVEGALGAVEQALALVPWHPRLQLLEVSILEEADPEAAAGSLTAALGRHPVEVAAYSWFRHRDIPWAALVPTAELPVEGRLMLVSQLAPLESYAQGEAGQGGAVVEGVLAAQALAAGGDVEGAIGRLEGLGESLPDAAGVQRLIVALRRR